MEGYKVYEKAIMAVIAKKYGLTDIEPKSVKKADTKLCNQELKDLMRGSSKPEIIPLSPAMAKKKFLRRFKELYAGI